MLFLQLGCKNRSKTLLATKLHYILHNFATEKKKGNIMKRILIVVAVTVLALIGFSFVSKSNANETVETDTKTDYLNIPLSQSQVKTAGISFGVPENRNIDTTLTANGQIVLRAKDKANVASLMGGIVKHIYVTDGQTVKKGQVVATIENTDVVSLQREYYSASKDCEFARLDMQRQKTLDKSGAGIKRNLEQANKEYHIAQARMQGIAQQLAQMGISTTSAAHGKFITSFPVKAPISGTVSGITASLGSYADMQTPLMTIRDNAAVECDLNVYEKDINKISTGDNVLMTVTNEPSTKIYGKVYGINKYFTDGSKSIAVHVKLLSGHDKIFDGQYVNGIISVGHRHGTTLPSKAIVHSDGKSYIFALNGKPDKHGYHFSRHEVTTGVTDNGYTAVKLCKHIQKGQEIVTDNAFYLASLVGDHGED